MSDKIKESPTSQEKQSPAPILDSATVPALASDKKTPQEKASEAKKMARDHLAKQVEEEASQEVDEDQLELEISQETEAPPKMEPLSVTLPEGKKYFRIGEAAEMIGVEPYVLRYWETEFKMVRPSKSRSGHRVYVAKDIKYFQDIRNLLYSEGFSIRDAKAELRDRSKQARLTSEAVNQFEKRHRDTLKDLANELRKLIQMLRR